MRLHSRRTMIALSYIIEEHAAEAGRETVLIASFQRLSLYAHQLERYRRIASRCATVYVLAWPDVLVPAIPGVVIIPLDASWPMVQEWDVIAYGPQISAGLFAQDRVGFSPEQCSSSFEGLFTDDSIQIERAVGQLAAALGLPTRTVTPDRAAIRSATASIRRTLVSRG